MGTDNSEGKSLGFMLKVPEIDQGPVVKCSQSERPVVTDYDQKKSFLDDFGKGEESDIDITIKQRLKLKRMKHTLPKKLQLKSKRLLTRRSRTQLKQILKLPDIQLDIYTNCSNSIHVFT